jgi:hypothetical protein
LLLHIVLALVFPLVLFGLLVLPVMLLPALLLLREDRILLLCLCAEE